jgi:hypothetical protein
VWDFEIFIALTITNVASCEVTPYSFADSYKTFGRTCSHHVQDKGIILNMGLAGFSETLTTIRDYTTPSIPANGSFKSERLTKRLKSITCSINGYFGNTNYSQKSATNFRFCCNKCVCPRQQMSTGTQISEQNRQNDFPTTKSLKSASYTYTGLQNIRTHQTATSFSHTNNVQ